MTRFMLHLIENRPPFARTLLEVHVVVTFVLNTIYPVDICFTRRYVIPFLVWAFHVGTWTRAQV